jgi:hypothetical protein
MSITSFLNLQKGGHKLIIYLAAASLILAGSDAFARTITINSLPYTCNTPWDTLIVGGNLSAGTGAITFSAGVHDVYLKGRGRTITFNTSGANGVSGIIFNNGSYNVKMESLTVVQSSATGSTNTGIMLSGPHDIKILDCNVHVKGPDSKNVLHPSTTPSYNVEIRGGNYTSFVNSFSSRCSNGAAVMILDYPDTTRGNYNYWVHNVVIDSCPHTGILIYGKSWVDSCTIWGNAHNDRYTRPSGNTCWSADNPYLVALDKGMPGARITYNTLRARTGREGARGIMVQNVKATAADPAVLAYNDIRVSNGPSDYEGARDETRGIRIRDIQEGWFRFTQYVYVHHNYVETVADNQTSTGHIGRGAMAFQFSAESGNTHGNRFFENTFIAMADTLHYADETGYVYANSPEIFNTQPYDNISSNNRQVSNGSVLALGAWNGGTSVWTSVGDTMEWRWPGYRNGDGFRAMVGVGSNGYNSYDNVIRDPVILGGSEDDVLNFDTSPGVEKELFFQRNLTVNVIGNNGLPVSGATVTVTNQYNRVVLNATSNSQGQVTGIVNYNYDRWIGNSHSDSVYNNFTIKARKNADSTIITFTIDSGSGAPQLTLSQTPGDGQAPDIIPPGAILDLGAVPGNGHGRLNLSWTAPGDDGDSGMAARYVIKYSPDLISEQNWPFAATVNNPPSPIGGGLPQSFTIENLPEGERFFTAIKAYDEVDNASPISNVPSGFASGIQAPAPLNTLVDEDQGTATLISSTVESYLPHYYHFSLDENPEFTNPRFEVDIMIDTAASVVFDSLVPNTIYYWRCRAMASDESDSSAWSSITLFDIQTGIGGLLSSDDCIYPPEGASVQTMYPTFIMRNVAGVGEFYIQVDEGSDFEAPFESGSVIAAAGPETHWRIPNALPRTSSYYWRISPDNRNWTEPLAFAADIDIHPYPNPYKASQGHQNITFTNLPDHCSINIATVSGSVVRKARDVGPNEWSWDVKNDSGRDVASGVYLYVVEFPRGSASGKVMVIR